MPTGKKKWIASPELADKLSLSQSMERCGRNSESTKDLQRECSSQLQQQLQGLTAIFNAGRTGAQQVLDLREAKATIRERLQATETALAESRQRALALESKEQLHIQRISSLELEAAKYQTKESESPQLMIRFQELNIRNATLKDEVAMSRQEAVEANRQLEEKCKDSSDLDERLKSLESELDEARLEYNKLLDFRLACEAKSVADMETLRRELCEAASFEQAKLESNYQNQLQQLRQQKKVAEDEAEERKRYLEMLQVEKDVVEGVASERLQALNELESKETQEVC
jgi:chromosome segregation ATPase